MSRFNDLPTTPKPPRFARRDYELAASVVRDALTVFSEPAHKVMLSHIAGRFASTFQIDNPQFDMERFTEACGITQANEKGNEHEA